MAYVIGSKKGQDIAKTLTTDKEWTNPADGSVWKKEKDGSVTVTHNGQTTTNAYKPTSNSSGGGGGGSSNKSTYSQYSNPYGDNVDLGTIGQDYMEQGKHWRLVEEIYNRRYNKATDPNRPDLHQYANDDIQKAMLDYILKGKEAENRAPEKESYASYQDVAQNRPNDYSKPYDPQIDALLNEILNRDDFSYDAQNDPLYQQYASMYHREGDRAMKETMAEAAAGAGGMNTYAITAAQQAANNYAAQLNDKIPELYQLAYDMYLADKESKVQDLGILQSMDATQYNRYRDTMADWKDDRNFAYDIYRDAVEQGNWKTNYDYKAAIDERNFNFDNFWANKEWNANQSQIAFENSWKEREAAEDQLKILLELGQTPSPELVAKAGWTQAEVDKILSSVLAEKSGIPTGYSGGGDNTSYTGGGYDNGGLDSEKVKQLQRLFGVNPDGLWGSQSEEAAGGLSADEAWEKYGDVSVVNPISYDKTAAMSNAKSIEEACKELLMTEGKKEVLEFLKERFKAGEIDTNSYNTLRNKYAG